MPGPRRREHAREPGHWAARIYYSDMRPFLEEIERCNPACSPNYRAQHIGVFHRGKGRDFNFVGLKPSRHANFSLEIKTDEDPAVLQELEGRGWYVEAYRRREGYQVHLPAGLNKAEIDQLLALVRRAYREWPLRMDR